MSATATSALPGEVLAPGILRPHWDVPANVRALLTTRDGGHSHAPWASFNLATHVGDDPRCVAANRARLRAWLPAEPLWLEQVHGVAVADADHDYGVPVADACIASTAQRVCAVLTADCLPVLLCDHAGTRVAAAHAGWRGLAAGVLEATIARLGVAPAQLRAWLGPAIGMAAFEVGDEVRAAFVAHDAGAAAAFVPGVQPGKWHADLFALARHRLALAGVGAVSGGGQCTVSQPAQFYSYRRDGQSGRFATLIWLESG